MISDTTQDMKAAITTDMKMDTTEVPKTEKSSDTANVQQRWRRLLIALSLVVALGIALIPWWAQASQADAAGYLKVTAKLLNGRSEPRKTASKEAFFDHGDILYATGAWSNDHKWVEVEGGETGTVWVSIRYVTERTETFKAKNANYDKVKVRKWPETGKVTKYIYRGQTVTIKKVILGYGLTKWGWVDLYYLEYAEGV